jgi:hypothetical protein
MAKGMPPIALRIPVRNAGHKRRKSTQNNLSETATCGPGCFRLKVMSCCLRFSRSRSRREPENRAIKTGRSLSRLIIRPGLHSSTGQTQHSMHLPDLAADRILTRYRYTFDVFNVTNTPSFDTPNNNVEYDPHFDGTYVIHRTASWESSSTPSAVRGSFPCHCG